MTTVGYGDKAPVTVGGRLVAVVWMFASLILIAVFTAHITSLLTVSHLDHRIRGPEDLPRYRVATVAGTTSENYLRRQGSSLREPVNVLLLEKISQPWWRDTKQKYLGE
jgi:ABC-type amino acid transport substrate-binding protein